MKLMNLWGIKFLALNQGYTHLNLLVRHNINMIKLFLYIISISGTIMAWGKLIVQYKYLAKG
jgi:hypothetical protein